MVYYLLVIIKIICYNVDITCPCYITHIFSICELYLDFIVYVVYMMNRKCLDITVESIYRS